MEYRQVQSQDIPAVASIFLQSFTPSVEHFLGKPLQNDRGICDIFHFIHRAEPQSFFVAASEDQLAGYLIANRSMRRIWLKAITQGDIFLWLYRWLSGSYNIGTGPIKSIIRHKLLFLSSKHNYRSSSQAQILSIAIHPDYKKNGIARELLNLGLTYLEGTEEIKLEVRPENQAAYNLYTSLGFEPIDKTADSQGDWIVMVKK
ncbi:MAG: GNAT family N-acetyltransferase [Clostridiales bacterium]|jgi:ribosomal protein S18 acetylase RimI-like enzyme|nr:GNAT family N-acetyltransferase [Clostridiales bacterium]